MPYDSFPFQRLLNELRLRHVPIGVGGYLRVGRLLRKWGGAPAGSLRIALAALLARNKKEVIIVLDTFDDLYGQVEQSHTPLQDVPQDQPTKGLAYWGTRVVLPLVFISGIVTTWYVSIDKPQIQTVDQIEKPSPIPEREQEAPQSQSKPPEPPTPPDPPEILHWGLPGTIATLLAILVFALLYQGRCRQASHAQAKVYWRNQLQALPGAQDYELALKDLAAPFHREEIDDLATILGRSAGGFTWKRLDIPKTIRQTVRAGLIPTLVYQERGVAPPLVVLQDFCHDMHPWNRRVDAFLEGLVLRGVAMERWYFDGDGLRVGRSPRGPFESLKRVYHRHLDSSLLVISTGFGVTDLKHALRPWVDTLAGWRLRSWINPIVDQSRWRKSLKKVPMRIWPMNAQGLLGAAYDIAMDEERRIDVGDLDPHGQRAVTPEDVRRMQRLVALVPYADVNLAERLRQKYCPDIPDLVMLDLIRLGTDATGRVLRWERKELAQLLKEAREDSSLEEQVRRLLLKEYEESEPEHNTVAHLRWRLDCAMQRVYLHDPEDTDMNRGLTELADLGAGPLREEVAEAVDRLDVPGERSSREEKLTIAEPISQHIRQKIEGLIHETKAGRTVDEEQVATVWPLPGLREWVTAFIVGIVAVAGTVAFDAIPKEIMEHRHKAYEITWTEHPALARGENPSHGVLGMKRIIDDGEIPLEVSLYQGSNRIDDGLDLSKELTRPLYERDRGHWYHLRAQLKEGNWALSEPMWVPGDRVPVLGSLQVTFISGLGNVDFRDTPYSLSNGRETRKGRSHRSIRLTAGEWLLEANPKGHGRVTKTIAVTPNEDNRQEDETRIDIEIGEYGTIRIVKIPDQVELSEIIIGGAPVASKEFRSAPGEFEVTITDELFAYKETISVTAAQMTEVAIDAEPKYGSATFILDPDIAHAVTITPMSRKSREPAPIELESNNAFVGVPGDYLAKVKANGFLEQPVEFALTLGKHSRVPVTLLGQAPRPEPPLVKPGPMVLIPTGTFTMGSPTGEGNVDERPQRQVYLDAYSIDQYEVTTARYNRFNEATGRKDPRYWDIVDLKRDGNKPVVGISWHDAKAYCAWAGKRLPTEAEWEKAARGTEGRTYPWGEDPPTQQLANFDKCCDFQDYGVLTDVGSLEDGKSPYGAYDMAGNVWEWVEDWYSADYYEKSPDRNPTGPPDGTFRVLRGGSWGLNGRLLRSADRSYYTPTYVILTIGIRCAKDAP